MSENSDIGAFLNQIHQGDAADRLSELPENSVHMAMCSPPYFGLRDYGADAQIGLEDSVDEYIDSLVEVANELHRVLRDDGSWWLNLGDTFQQKSKMLIPHRVAIALQDAGWIVRSDAVWSKPNPMPNSVKDRLHEHKEFLFHLTPEPYYWFDLDSIREPHKESSIGRADQSYKDSGVPANAYPDRKEGVSNGTEPEDALHPNGKNPGDIFEVSTRPFPDAHFAVYPPELCESPIKSSSPEYVCSDCGAPYDRITEQVPMWERDPSTIERKQSKRALEIAEDAGLTDDHFEAARSVGIGNLDGGEGNPYDRVDDETESLAREAADVLGSYYREALMSETDSTDDWEQTCDCETNQTSPGIVLDMFAGAGTTLLVAKNLGRRFIGIELNEEYIAMAQKRIGITVDQPELVDGLVEDGQKTLNALTDGGPSGGGD